MAKNSIFTIIGASNHTDKPREINDYYATDPIAIDKLVAVEDIYPVCWECACGGGHLSERLKHYNKTVFSSDLIDRGYKGFNAQIDFLMASAPPIDGEFDIITNPPYSLASAFVTKSIKFIKPGRKCYMFLKLTFLEGKNRYLEIFQKFTPKTVYVFSERVLCAKNAEFERMIAGGGSAVAYAWFVWEKGYKGETTIKWI